MRIKILDQLPKVKFEMLIFVRCDNFYHKLAADIQKFRVVDYRHHLMALSNLLFSYFVLQYDIFHVHTVLKYVSSVS